MFAQQTGITVGVALRDLELVAGAMTEAELENHVQYLPL